MKPFVESYACRSGRHCRACRDREGGREFRIALSKTFATPAVDFACPHGAQWGAQSPPFTPAERRDRKPCGGCGGGNTSGRESCIECVEKHIGAAMVLIDEVADGYGAHRLRAVGHLHEAADESRAWPELHDALRAARRAYQNDGTAPDWARLAALAASVRHAPETDHAA